MEPVRSIPVRSPDLEAIVIAARPTYPGHLTFTAMATLQPKGSIISRTAFAALDVEEPEFEEEPEVVELPPVE